MWVIMLFFCSNYAEKVPTMKSLKTQKLDFTPLKLNLIEFVGTLEIPNTESTLEHTFNLAILYVLTGNSKQ